MLLESTLLKSNRDVNQMGRLVIVAIIIGGIVLVVFLATPSPAVASAKEIDNNPANVEDLGQTSVTIGAPTPVQEQLPADESTFISTIIAFSTRYTVARMSFQKSSLRRERSNMLAKLIPSLSVANSMSHISTMRNHSR